jgi:hypothetical protein
MKKLIIPLGLTGLFGFFMVGVLLAAGHWYVTFDPAPVQPINYSHRIHVDKVGLACTHCHRAVGVSRQATVPSLDVCMACHKNVATDRPEIQKLTGYWQRKEPIAWKKVHNVPWHVYFTHKRHIQANIDCADCHGEIGATERVGQVRSLEMGWCVSCHRSKGAPTDCWTCHK